jgi:hypothetical protein
MWSKSQNFTKPIQDKDGHLWHFLVWQDFPDGVYTQRIFFWNNDQTGTGMVEFSGDQTLTMAKLKQRITKLAASSEYREQLQCNLSFPIERYYGNC